MGETNFRDFLDAQFAVDDPAAAYALDLLLDVEEGHSRAVDRAVAIDDGVLMRNLAEQAVAITSLRNMVCSTDSDTSRDAQEIIGFAHVHGMPVGADRLQKLIAGR